jgi:phage gpG-like protein
MPNINDLAIKIQALKTELINELPKHVAADMHTQTMHNFDTEAYTNNATPQKWPDRPRENELGYKKLDHTGKLKRSITPMKRKTGSKSVVAGIKTAVDYAKAHNEGGVSLTGSPWRNLKGHNPPKRVNINRSGLIHQRRFMGIGSRTIAQAKKRINEILRKHL